MIQPQAETTKFRCLHMDRSNKVLEVVALISNWGTNFHMGEKDKVYDPKQTDVFPEQCSTHVR